MSAQQKLLNWCKGQTNGYAGVIIENFHLSWRNGLVHSLAPNCGIVFDQLNADDMIGNNTLAFDSAFKHLGISKLLEPNDMVEGTKPEQFSVMTYLGQFFKKFGTSSRPALTRTNTSPVLMTEEKQKQLAALSDVRQRFGVGKVTNYSEGDSDVTDSTTVDGKKKRKPMQRTVSTSQIKSPDQMTASEKLKAAKLGEQFKKGGTTEKPANDLVKKCHKSGVSLLGVKAIEWNGQSYHPDHFKCTTCSVAFSKNILNVGNEPYCEKCYRKALVKNKLKKQDTVSGGEPPKINSTTSTTSTEKKDIRDIYEQEEAERLKKIAEESKKAAAESETERKEAESKTPEVVEQKSSIPAWRQKLLERKNATTDAKPEDNKAEKEAAEKKAAEEKATADKLAQEKAAADKKEKDDKEAAEKKAAEEQADKLAQEKAADKLAQEKAAAEKLAQEKAAAEKSAAEKLAQEKAAAEKLAEEKAAAEKLAQEKAASDKLAQEKAAAEKLAQEKAAAEKLSQEKAAAEKKEQERLAQEKAAAEKKAAEEKVEAERIARERAETEKKEQERLAQERAAAEKALAEKLATEKALQEEANRKAAEERKAAEREAEAKAAAEREAAEKLRAEKLLADKLAEEKLEKERIERAAEAERIANEKRKQGDEVAALTGQLDSEKNYSKSLEVEIQRLKDELAALRNDSEQSFNNNIEVTTKLRQENAMLREQISKIQASGHLAETIAAEEKALQEKLAQDKLNQEKAALERQNQYKLEQERKEQERKEQERKEQERKEQERKEQERKEQERNEQEKVEQQKLVFKNDVKPTNTLTSTTSSTALQSAHNRGSDTGVRISCWSCAMLNASRYKFCFNCGSPKDLPTGTTPNNNAEKEAADKLALEKAAAEKLAQEKIAAEKAAAEKLAKEKQQQQQNVQLKPTTSSKTPLTQQEYKRPEKVIPEWQRKLLEKKAAQAGQTK